MNAGATRAAGLRSGTHRIVRLPSPGRIMEKYESRAGRCDAGSSLLAGYHGDMTSGTGHFAIFTCATLAPGPPDARRARCWFQPTAVAQLCPGRRWRNQFRWVLQCLHRPGSGDSLSTGLACSDQFLRSDRTVWRGFRDWREVLDCVEEQRSPREVEDRFPPSDKLIM